MQTFPENFKEDTVYRVAGRDWMYKRHRGWVPYNRVKRLNNSNFNWEYPYQGASSQAGMNEILVLMTYETSDVTLRHFNGNEKSTYRYNPTNYEVYDGNSGSFSIEDSIGFFTVPDFETGSDSYPDSDFVSPFS